MATLSTDVLVIGGGATGAGVAWDASLRGLDVVLVDRADLAEGTSGRFHGLLHSGGRYAVKDPRAAEECIAENRILRKVAAGLHRGHRRASSSPRRGRPRVRRQVRRRVPRHRRRLRGDRPGAGAARGAAAAPGHLAGVPRPRREHRGLEDRVGDGPRRPAAGRADPPLPRCRRHPSRAATRSPAPGCAAPPPARRSTIEARVTVNASGAWAGQFADMAGIEGVRVLPGRGIMIAMNHRLVNTCVNRCQMPTDGDIIVPIRTVCVIGTTDVHTDDPDDQSVIQSEVDAMLDDGEKLVPGLPPGAGAAGVDRRASAVRGRQGGRHRHARRHPRACRCSTTPSATASNGFVTITGGKLTTFRLMAEETDRRGLPPPRRRASVHDQDRAATRLGERARLPARRASEPQGGPSRRRAVDLRVRAGPAREARAGDRAPATHEPRRRPPPAAARDGALPGRLLHLSRDRGPARARRAHRRAGRRVAAATSSRSGGRECGRSSTAISFARPALTNGSFRACWTWRICPVEQRVVPREGSSTTTRS